MELLVALIIGILVGCGVYLVVQAGTFSVVVGLALLGYGVNLLLFSSGGLHEGAPPLIVDGASNADPLPQALVLTAIVIGFGMTAFAVIVALRARSEWGTDHVDGQGGEE